MTPDERALLERTAALAEESNQILKKMRRSARITFYLQIAYWVIILGLTFGAFYLIQPYVNSLLSGLGGGSGSSSYSQELQQAMQGYSNL